MGFWGLGVLIRGVGFGVDVSLAVLVGVAGWAVVGVVEEELVACDAKD